MNSDRLAEGCSAFLWDNRIATAAQECADTMAAVGSVASCSSLDTRLRNQGISAYNDASENQVMNSSMAAAQANIVSDHARSALLYNCNFVIAGVGIALGTDGRTMWFCQSYLDP